MKIIEALKKIKDLSRKATDLLGLVKNHCALSSLETPKYDNQAKQVSEWIQAHSDVVKEVLRLRLAIQKTNLETDVSIEIGDKVVVKSIAAWIQRRRDLAKTELAIWNALTDRGIREGIGTGPTGDPMEIKIQRFYDPAEQDRRRELYSSEPSTIDAQLEITNAITDLIE